jgi:predicted DNA binding protein
MREFTFAVRYESGADRLMDVFHDTSSLTGVSFDGCVFGDRFWRLERFSGPAEALDAVERVRLDDTYDEEGVTVTPVTAERHHERVERDDSRLLLYSYVSDIRGGDSVHSIAGHILDEGALFETRRHEGRHEWRILLRSDRNVGQLYDTLTGRLRDGLTFETGHLREVEAWNPALLNEPALPGEQQVALRTAWELGYYETPSEASLDDIAEELGVPRSTLSYRLRRAEAQLVRGYFQGPG